MSKYLLELGVEELPYGLISSLCAQIKENFEKKLQENNAEYTSIETFSTPRRLVFIIDGLNEIQSDIEKIHRGPNLKVATDVNGNYTQAAMGFARKFGANVEQLYTIEENGQEYIALKVCEKGKALTELIPNIVPDCILKVQGSHFMRWSTFDEKFSRPIRWIVSILDEKEIPVEITGIKSSKKSRAHRFCSNLNPEITSVEKYFDIMKNHNVIVNEEERKTAIVKAVKELAASINAEVKIEEELLKEVTNIVEWPHPVLGNFDEKYLAIPEPVIVTVMASHQRYFPIYGKNGKLLNGFITVANYIGDDVSNIKNGNERVIKARLDDAIFFYNEDLKKPLIDRVEDLDGMTFQKGLGSIKDKVNRIVEISKEISKTLGYTKDQEKYNNILRTALLCKADLTTSLVFEFTELQGVIGAHYAKVNNEPATVAQGIEEHYYPIVADAQLAESLEGQIVGIADKLDTVCSVFALNKIPSGSVDPLGARRAAVGILQTIMQKKLALNISDLINFTIKKYPVEIADTEKLKADILAFFSQRLKGIFAGKYQTDFIDAVLSAKENLASLNDLTENLELLSKVSQQSDFDKIVAAHSRINKLVKNNLKLAETEITSYKDIMDKNCTPASTQKDILHKNPTFVINQELIKSQAEDDLYRYALELEAKTFTSGEDFYKALVSFIPIIDKFFEDVMVMDEDVLVRNNRIRILAKANKEFLRIADFTKILK